MPVNRQPIFAAVKQLRNGQPFTMAEVHLLDAAIDEAFGVISPVPQAKKLGNPAGFFDHLRNTNILGPALIQNEVDGCNILLDAMGNAYWGRGWAAYGLATAYHETAGTMQPIREYGRGKGKAYGKPQKYSQAAYGRGYVQLTWDKNYEVADEALGLGGKLLANFDLALVPSIASRILVRGMQDGWFTGKKLGDYMPIDAIGDAGAFKKCRPIVNGNDRDTLIANDAVVFSAALEAGAWS